MPLRPVDPNVSFPELEEKWLDRWDAERIFERSVEEKDASKAYSFFDGPPFATGLPHYGHLVASVLKDVVPRYWAMRGYRVERRWGWDCHGLPVENVTEKELGLKEKRDVERFGVFEFNEACRGVVLRFTQEWRQTIRRMGRWVDFDGGYRTMDRDYMESVWWVFRQLWDKDLIYPGFRVQPYCTRCGTPLSNFELNQPGGYRDRQDPSVTVRLPLVDRADAELWVWTTTPWTLPSNTAVAAGPDVEYWEVPQEGGRNAILAAGRVPHYFPDLDEGAVVRRYTGKELAGLRYEPLFAFQPVESDKQYTVLLADYVSTEDGSGLVHQAPAYGEDDFVIGQANGLPVFRPIGPDGRFTEAVPPYAGQSFKEADKAIMKDLKDQGRVVRHDTLDHSYPHCYRCDSPLIYQAMDTWFMRIDPVKPAMLAANAKTSWVPEGLRDGRFGNWLQDARDWNFSRNRFWGTPIPVWRCDAESCDEQVCVGSVEELEGLVGESCGDLHKHYVDAHTWACGCGGTMRRISEIFDCWFESGSMPYAQLHYPFENKDEFEQRFPANFIAEGLDQTRGWFYTLTVLAASLRESPAFENVIVNGIVLAEDGEKMSKSKQNFPNPNIVLEKYGADALRLYLVNSPVVAARDLRFSEAGVAEQVRSVLLPLWNAYSFLSRYADVDGWEPDGVRPDPSLNELDGWVLSRLQTLVGTVNHHMERYELFRVVPALLEFVDDLTNWYIRLSRPRFWRGADAAEAGLADKTNAYRSLHHVLLTLAKTLAPFLPFVADEMHANLSSGQGADSVHLEDYPEPEEALQDSELETRMALARTAVNLGRSLRVEHSVRTRQPLRTLTVCAADPDSRAGMERMARLIEDELNVKSVVLSGDESDLVTYAARPNLKLLGPKFGKQLKAIRAEVEGLDSALLERVVAGEGIPSASVEGLVYDGETLLVDRRSREGLAVSTEGALTVALDLQVDDELRLEGLAREVVNRVQGARKEANLALDDRIQLELRAAGELAQAIGAHWSWIASQVLAQKQLPGLDGTAIEGAAFDVDGSELRLSLTRA